jgi:signal peptidase I
MYHGMSSLLTHSFALKLHFVTVAGVGRPVLSGPACSGFSLQEKLSLMLYKLLLFLPLVVLIGGFFLARTGLVVIMVYGQSMAPALQHGDRLLIVRRWLTRRPSKGQIVVVTLDMHRPGATLFQHENYYIKRVVAVGGESYSAPLFANAFSQRALAQGHESQPEDEMTWSIPRNHVFVCGDNVRESVDSRTWGPLPLRNISGRVLLRLSPARPSSAIEEKIARLTEHNVGE